MESGIYAWWMPNELRGQQCRRTLASFSFPFFFFLAIRINWRLWKLDGSRWFIRHNTCPNESLLPRSYAPWIFPTIPLPSEKLLNFIRSFLGIKVALPCAAAADPKKTYIGLAARVRTVSFSFLPLLLHLFMENSDFEGKQQFLFIYIYLFPFFVFAVLYGGSEGL